jgi:hypothetical protein
MNLGPIEDHVLQALRTALGPAPELHAGPVQPGPATGLLTQVFVHVTYTDAGGYTAEGAQVARQPLQLPRGVQGYSEQRPGWLDVEVHLLCAQHRQAQQLAGRAAPVLLEALQTLAPPLLSPAEDRLRQLRFADFRAHVRGQRSARLVHEGVAVAQVVLALRVEGFVHLHMARSGGFQPIDPYDQPLRLHIDADPAGTDLQREHVQLLNAGTTRVDLAGWTLHDAARRPHSYRFGADVQLAPGASLRLWTGRGRDDAGNLYWGRRAAVWNNTGDVAVLRDPADVERARAQWLPPLPVPTEPAERGRKARTSTPARSTALPRPTGTTGKTGTPGPTVSKRTPRRKTG